MISPSILWCERNQLELFEKLFALNMLWDLQVIYEAHEAEEEKKAVEMPLKGGVFKSETR